MSLENVKNKVKFLPLGPMRETFQALIEVLEESQPQEDIQLYPGDTIESTLSGEQYRIIRVLDDNKFVLLDKSGFGETIAETDEDSESISIIKLGFQAKKV